MSADTYCVDCGVTISTKALRCADCKRINNNKNRKEKRKLQIIVTYCIGCGEDISILGNRSSRCEKCQRDYRNLKRREKRAKEKEGIVRICEQCGDVNISDRYFNATICWSCRRKNRDKGQKRWNQKHKKEHKEAQQKYYDKNRKKTIKDNLRCQRKQRKKKKEILNMELPEDDGNRDIWMDWDNIPRCEGITLDIIDGKNTFGNKCKMRAEYRLVDKYDKTVRYVCNFHVKTLGNLKWYHIEQLGHDTTIRRTTLFKWKRIQKEEKKKKIKKWKEKRKDREKKPIGTYYNAHYPIINGSYQDQVPYPSDDGGE